MTISNDTTFHKIMLPLLSVEEVCLPRQHQTNNLIFRLDLENEIICSITLKTHQKMKNFWHSLIVMIKKFLDHKLGFQ